MEIGKMGRNAEGQRQGEAGSLSAFPGAEWFFSDGLTSILFSG